jgi:8-oxo-dGTP pyrophosphatase MutT (NUDIX family)
MATKHGPWVIEETTHVYEDEFIKVNEDKVIKPDGQGGTYATARVKPGVAVLAVEEEGSVYLTKQFRYATGRDSIEVVCGALEEGEPPLEAAKRELREEVGIEASEWRELGTIDLEGSIVNCQSNLFIAKSLKQIETDRDPTERIKTLQVTLGKAVDMVMNCEITHGPSIALILKTHNLESKPE